MRETRETAQQEQDLDKTTNDQPQEPKLKGESPMGRMSEIAAQRDEAAQFSGPDARTFYGPHDCDVCGATIVRAALAQGGQKYDQPAGPVYPTTNWQPHQCVPGVRGTSGTPGESGAPTRFATCDCGGTIVSTSGVVEEGGPVVWGGNCAHCGKGYGEAFDEPARGSKQADATNGAFGVGISEGVGISANFSAAPTPPVDCVVCGGEVIANATSVEERRHRVCTPAPSMCAGKSEVSVYCGTPYGEIREDTTIALKAACAQLGLDRYQHILVVNEVAKKLWWMGYRKVTP